MMVVMITPLMLTPLMLTRRLMVVCLCVCCAPVGTTPPRPHSSSIIRCRCARFARSAVMLADAGTGTGAAAPGRADAGKQSWCRARARAAHNLSTQTLAGAEPSRGERAVCLPCKVWLPLQP